MKVRCLYCSNPVCSRHIFAEPLSALLGPCARRTHRLAEIQGRIGNAPGARLLKHLRIPASYAAVLRLVRTTPMPDAPAPVHVGVDDWAMRKGRSYSSIVMDPERHRVVDLLPDCTAATLAGWFRQQTGIRVWPRTARSSTPVAPTSTLPKPCMSLIVDTLLANILQAVER